jgi:transcriptional regulator with XRE-family HTH domain
MNDRQLGERIAYWRQRRGLTQKLFADRLGRSKSWVEKVEAGRRSADRLPILVAICNELRLDLPVLIGHDLARDTRNCIDDLQVEMIRAALERYEMTSTGESSEPPADPTKMQRQVTYIWSAFEVADYQVVSRNLPGLLLQAKRSNMLEASDTTARILAEIYQIAASTLRKLGEYDLAWLAGDRGITLAERVGDPVLSALTGYRVVNALSAIGRPSAAFELSMSLASRLEPTRSTESEMSVYGHMVLQAAMAAASNGEAGSVRDLIREAEEVARQIPDQSNHHHLSFGPTNVAVHHVAAQVSLGEGGLAIEAASAMDENGVRLLRRERRANHLVDVARGYSQWGTREKALERLLEAEALAPREVNCRPLARNTIEDLIRRSRGKPTSALQSLAERAGVVA